MGCNQSTGSLHISKKHREEQIEEVDVNSNSKISSEPVYQKQEEMSDEMASIERFKSELMAQLQAIGENQKPPMAPLQPVEGDPRHILTPSLFKSAEALSELKKTPLPENSNLIITYLKSGTHWLWEITKMLRKGRATADEMPKEMAHLEFFSPSVIKSIHGQEPEVFCTHFPLWAIPSTCFGNNKVVYAYRNPKDVCVSNYHHYLSMSAANPKDFPKIPFDSYFEIFLAPSEKSMMGNWFDHVADFWDNHRTNPNILCVSFEDMKKDPLKEIKRINAHFNTEANDELLEEIVKATSFETLKKTKESSEQHLSLVFKGTMYRKGQVGDWKNQMNEEQNSRIEAVIAKWQSERTEPVPLVYEL